MISYNYPTLPHHKGMDLTFQQAPPHPHPGIFAENKSGGLRRGWDGVSAAAVTSVLQHRVLPSSYRHTQQTQHLVS